MKQRFRQVGVGLAIIAGLLFAGGLYYSLPRTAKVTVTGTDVKRMDAGKDANGNPKTRDVRFIYAENVDNKTSMAFRNEDTGWGFPFYFKFDSGDIAAKAMNFERNEKDAVVLVTYYGPRVPMLNEFPNVISMKKVSAEYVHIPIFNIVFLVLFFAALIFLYVKTRKVLRAAGAKTKELVGRSDPPEPQ